MSTITLKEALSLCFNPFESPSSRSGWFKFLEGCQPAERRGQEHRKNPRKSLEVDAAVVPVDADLRPLDRPFVGLTRDISTSGICATFSRPVDAPYLVIRMENENRESIQLIARVVRCKRRDSLYEVAGEFVFDAEIAPRRSKRR